MSKETTAKLMGTVTANVSPAHLETLSMLGVLNDKGLLNIEADPKLKKLADVTVNPEKVQALGTVYADIGMVRQRIGVFINGQGEVFCSSDIKSGTGFTYRLPLFVNKEHKAAWNALRQMLPTYLQQAGII